jgi:hypothetical protein
MKLFEWFKSKKTLIDVLIKSANTNTILLEAYRSLKNEYDVKNQCLVKLICAMVLQHGGTLIVNKNFIEAAANNPLKLDMISKDNGDMEVVLLEPGE